MSQARDVSLFVRTTESVSSPRTGLRPPRLHDLSLSWCGCPAPLSDFGGLFCLPRLPYLQTEGRSVRFIV